MSEPATHTPEPITVAEPRGLATTWAPPRDCFVVETASRAILDQARSLWRPAPAANRRDDAVVFRLAERRAPDGSDPATANERWEVEGTTARVRLGDHVNAAVDVAAARVDGWASTHLLASAPATAARLLLEAPAAFALASRSWQVLHAAAVVGPAGAVVVRGPNDAGKSTTIAAAWLHGLQVLGDESVLAARDDPGHLAVTVREVLVCPAAARLLGLDGAMATVVSGGDLKYRLDLGKLPRPEDREAVHVATVLLGDRDRPGGARLDPLGEEEFLADFGRSEIPQERWFGDPEPVARDWARRPAFRLDGASDLDGAVVLLRGLVTAGGVAT